MKFDKICKYSNIPEYLKAKTQSECKNVIRISSIYWHQNDTGCG